MNGHQGVKIERVDELSLAVVAAKRATFVVFAGSGFAMSSWASRIPQLRDALGLNPSTLGLVLLAMACGSVLALPLTGPMVGRVGSRVVVTSMACLLGVGLLTLAVGQLFGVAAVATGLFLIGFANGSWDVAMNIQAAVVERRLHRSIMSRFHAGYSIGTVAGALVGALAVTAHVSVTVHLCVVATVTVGAVLWCVRSFLPELADRRSALERQRTAHRTWGAWLEPRTLLIGIFVLSFAFSEGAGQDWISLAMIDDYATPAAVGALGFATFLMTMTCGRWFGPTMLDRFGRVPVLRVSAVVNILGLAVFIWAPLAPAALVGAALWGFGSSLGFPVGMSAGADDPTRAAARVSVIASIGYCAFLAGPPLLGVIGKHSSILMALMVVPVLLTLAVLVAPAIQEPNRREISGSARKARRRR